MNGQNSHVSHPGRDREKEVGRTVVHCCRRALSRRRVRWRRRLQSLFLGFFGLVGVRGRVVTLAGMLGRLRGALVGVGRIAVVVHYEKRVVPVYKRELERVLDRIADLCICAIRRLEISNNSGNSLGFLCMCNHSRN